MQFARPGGALLLLLLPLLVLLHARGGRRQGRVVPSVALWDDVPTDARGNPRRPRVPISWEFVLQAAVVVTGAVALMGPTPSGHTPVSRRVVLVVDTSVSMAATDVRPARLAAAKATALEILAERPRGARAALILAGPRADVVVPFTTDLGAIRAAIADAAATDAAADVPSAVTLAHSLLGGARADIHVFTHFFIHDDASGSGPSPTWHIFASGRDNVAVGDLRVGADSSSGSPDGYVARLRVTNYGRGPARVSTVLTPSQGQPVAQAASVEAGATVEVEFVGSARRDEDVAFRAQAQHEDGLDRDNHAYAVLPAARPLDVVVVGRDARALAAVIALDASASVTVSSPDVYLPRDDTRLTVFHGWEPPTLPTGDVVLLGPPAGAPHAPDRAAQGARFIDPGQTHDTLRLVNLAGITPRLVGIYDDDSTGAHLMLTEAGPAALAWDEDDRRVLAIGFDPFDVSASDMSLRPAMVVLMSNVLDWARAGRRPIPHAIDAGRVVSLPDRAAGYALEPVGEHDSATLSVSRAGIYTLSGPSGTRELFAANVAPGQSDLWAQASGPPATTPGGAEEPGLGLWRWFALAALLFLCAEWALYHRRPTPI